MTTGRESSRRNRREAPVIEHVSRAFAHTSGASRLAEFSSTPLVYAHECSPRFQLSCDCRFKDKKRLSRAAQQEESTTTAIFTLQGHVATKKAFLDSRHAFCNGRWLVLAHEAQARIWGAHGCTDSCALITTIRLLHTT